MIPRILWAGSNPNETSSPFLRGKKERPLKITFHSSSFINLSDEDIEAIEALRQLSNLSDIEALDTNDNGLPRLEIGFYEKDAPFIPITVTARDYVRQSGIFNPQQWEGFACQLAGQENLSHPDSIAMLADIHIAQAHYQLGYDILITLSERLLSHRSHNILRKANPFKPTEAARLVGLFLRSRDNYTWTADQHVNRCFDKGSFYWVLTRHRLPSLWKYFSACVHAEDYRRDDTLFLGQSILVRSARALQARDAIATEFYIPQSNNTRDTVMYHFDYLTLLLSGAFDAQALIALRAYRIPAKEWIASFRKSEFQQLLRNHGATDLYNLVVGQKFQDTMTLLYELRNTIHKASLPTIGYKEMQEEEQSYVVVLPDYAPKIQQAAERSFSMNEWGLKRMHELVFDPHTYAVALIKECFCQIDKVANITCVDGLFPDGVEIPPLNDSPPNDRIFAEKIRKRLNALGW